MTDAPVLDAPNVTDLRVLHADAWLAVVDKPAGLMVHDSALARGETDFAADRLRAQFGKPIFLVHRLDRATSGCLLLAFDRASASELGKAMMAGPQKAQAVTRLRRDAHEPSLSCWLHGPAFCLSA